MKIIMNAHRHSSILCLLLFCGCAPRTVLPDLAEIDHPDVDTSQLKTYALLDGSWFMEGRFISRTMYAVNGELQHLRPARVDSAIDLQGGFVVPPFGDAHTHNLSGAAGFEQTRDDYLREGTFYVQVLTNPVGGKDAVAERVNVPESVDAVYADAAFTASGGHPHFLYEGMARGHYTHDQRMQNAQEIVRGRRAEGNAYVLIDSLPDLDARWEPFLASRPGLVKVMLVESERYHEFRRDAVKLIEKGLDPELIPEIVRRASAAGLRVWAHVATAHDVDVAIRAGVAGLAHLPGCGLGRDADPGAYQISEATAQLAGARRIAITPTAWTLDLCAGEDSLRREQIRNLSRRNLRLLEQHGVQIAVGSDMFGHTARNEVNALQALELWSNTELLNMWAVTTPQLIFPRRMFAQLLPGYEASFLVLDCSPVVELSCVDKIRLRVKQGRILAPGPGVTP